MTDALIERLRSTAWEHRLHRSYRDEAADALESKDAKISALQKQVDEWLAANAPEGWIDALRADADRLDWMQSKCSETPLNPACFGSEFACDMRLIHKLPPLISYDCIGQQITLRAAIDAARGKP